jgi:DNA mismatch repair protein MutS2
VIQKSSPSQRAATKLITSLRFYVLPIMDKKSLRTLEFDKILGRLANYVSFSAGEELARSLMPTTDVDEARLWQTQTSEARELLDVHTSVTIGAARDVRRAVDNSWRRFTLPAEELLDVRNTIVAARN